MLALVQGLNARGARPYLLVPGRPNTAGDAANWWLAVGQVADIVVQTYLDAPTLAQQGPLLASRTIRQAYRSSVRTLSSIGVPLTRIGIMLGFQSGPGQKGREGLQPQAAWLEVVKLQTLAARQIALDESIGSVWSWGWGTFSASGNDPDKALAACVHLWARDPALCDAPTAAGPAFDASREEGQLILPPGLLCSFAGGQIAEADVQALTPLAGDRRKALGVLFTRALLYDRYPVPWASVARAERGVLAREFARQPAGLRQALEGVATSLGTARAVLADGLRRREVEATLPVTPVSTASVAAWAKLHLGVRTRRISVTPAAPWLGGASTGVAVATLAPAAVFTARPKRVTLVHTTTGTYRVQPLGNLRALKSLPLREAQPAITAALRAERQRAAFPAWLAQQQQAALATATCLRDELPPTGEVDLSRNLPFLRLDAQ